MLTAIHSPMPVLPTIRVGTRRRHEMRHCDVCGIVVEFEHTTLAHPASRRLICCCQTCATHLTGGGSGKYRRVPDRAEMLPDFRMSDAQWAALCLPINLAFMYYSTPDRAVLAVYPDASGPIESGLPKSGWEDLSAANPILREFQPDVEALVINRVGDTRRYFRAPIDECFKLTSFMRDHWNGATGGVDLWRKVEWCFDTWKRRFAARTASA